MELIRLTQHVYYFHAAVNIGYITYQDKGLLIDSGIDASASKKVIKLLAQKELPLNYIVLTHAHADHIGGAKWLQENKDVEIYAPKMEGAVMENTILEPIYLWNGAEPLPELKNKFLMAESIQIHSWLPNEGEIQIGPFTLQMMYLPGHSYQQIGLSYESILFAADALFGIDVLAKHKIPFIVSARKTMDTLKYLLDTDYIGVVPGHGQFEAEPTYKKTIRANLDVHHELINTIYEFVQRDKTVSFHQVIEYLLRLKSIHAKNIASWLLFRTSITAYLTYLVESKKVHVDIRENRLMVHDLTE
ncbi:MBL fold metallo-hydrolase [Bacillus spongiae]|uniref:MBL fold metallo-hydrolase n=1 Tax=Bacillus spongiae TaxID=2683610 RepID=A0ABU8HB64_9BACI